MAPKKKEQQKMSLGEFLTDEKMGSWADEMEDMPVSDSRTGYGTERRTYSATTGTYGSGNAGGYSVREEPNLPDKPPFTVHLGNLSFDATTGDVSDFFSGCYCSNVRIIEDRVDMKPKGFGYAEFANRDGLKQALTLNGSQFQGRSIRISIADPPKDRGDRPEAREISDWSRKGPLPDLPARSGMGGNRREYDRGFGADNGNDRRDRFPEGDGRVRDLGNWERKGPLPNVTQPESERFLRDSGRSMTTDGPRSDVSFRDRRPSPAAWGENRKSPSQEGSRPLRREFQDRPILERAPTAAEQDNQWRSKMRPDVPSAKSPVVSREGSEAPSSPVPSMAMPLGRPKLNLAKRTVSEVVERPNTSTSFDSKASPFGAARPIDTAAKEKEIEEKRLAALKEKKELEEIAIEEKKEASIRAALEAEELKKIEILQRSEETSVKKQEKNDEVLLNSSLDNKTVKSKETEPNPKSKSSESGAWRRASNGPLSLRDDIPKGPRAGRGGIGRGRNDGRESLRSHDECQTQQNVNGASTHVRSGRNVPEDSGARALEEDGWSTVSKHKKNSRGGNQAARVIAS